MPMRTKDSKAQMITRPVKRIKAAMPIPTTGQKAALIWEEARDNCRGNMAAMTRARSSQMNMLISLRTKMKGRRGNENRPPRKSLEIISPPLK